MAAAVGQMPVDRWKPYLKFHTASALAPYLSKEFVDARFEFYGRTLQGVTELEPRWKRAINNLENTLGEMLGDPEAARDALQQAAQRADVLDMPALAADARRLLGQAA